MSDYFLANANRMIGESARYARQFQASQAGTAALGGNPMGDLAAVINPLIMLALFQALAQMGFGGNSGLAPAAGPSGNGTLPYPPLSMQPASFASTPSAVGAPALDIGNPFGNVSPSPVNPPAAPPQSPAYDFITSLLNGGGSRPANLNLEDNVSIQSRIDRILYSSGNTMVRSLSYQLNAADPTSLEAIQTRDRIKTLLRQEGRSDTELKELDLLWDTAQLNRVQEQLEITSIGNPSDELLSRIDGLKQQRIENARQWDALYPITAPAGPEEMTGQIRTALQEGKFTEADMGQTLKYLMDRSPDGTETTVASLISNLTDSGNLNMNAFLNSGYLDKLSPERQTALLGAVRDAGLTQSSGAPNSRFMGFLLENLATPGDSSTKTFLRQFLQAHYTAQNGDLTTTEGKALAGLLDLSGIQPDAQNQLVFS